MPDIRSDLGRTIRETAIERFVTDAPAPTTRFNRACGLRDNGGRTEVNHYFDNLVRLGVLTMQATGNGNGKSPHVFNWTGRAVEDVTFADAVRCYLDDETIGDAAKANARVALRYLLDLGTKCADREIISAAEKVGAMEIRTVPARVYDLALQGSFKKPRRTAAQYRSYLRALIRHAAERNAIPIVHTPNWAGDPFTEAALKYFPRKEDRPEGYPIESDGVVQNMRAGYKRYAEAVIELYGEEAAEFADAADATDELVDAVCTYWIRQGNKHARDLVVALVGRLGSTFGVGPGATGARGSETPHILSADEGRISTGPEGIRNVLEDHGLTPSWGEAWTWMETWFSADDDTLRRLGFPNRLATKRVGPKSIDARIHSIRVLLGVAKYWLGWAGEKLAPEHILGTGYEEVIDELFRVWALRHKAGLNSGPHTNGLKAIVVQSGLCALALFNREGHAAGTTLHLDDLGSSAEKGNGVRRKTIRRQQSGMYKTPQQAAYWKAYDWSMNRDARITDEMRKVSRSQGSLTTVKDGRTIATETPYEFWFEFIDAMVAEIRRRDAEGDNGDASFHMLVWLCVVTATHVISGLRQQAATHIREGGQYLVPDGPVPFRAVIARVVDMKNDIEFETGFHEATFPWEIETIWRERTRPYFKQQGIAKGRLVEMTREEERRLRREGIECNGAIHPVSGVTLASHNWLLTDTNGVPYGCPEEDENGENRDERRHKNRVGQMGKLWKKHAIAFIAEHMKYDPPACANGFTLHNARGVIAQRLKDEDGIEAAANYLSDTVKTVERSYTVRSGKSVDLAKHLRSSTSGDPVASASASSDGVLAEDQIRDFAGYRTAVADLRELLNAGDLTEGEFGALREEEKRRWGIKAAA